MTDPFGDYDPFARAYARYWGPGFTERVLPHLRTLLLDSLAPGSRVLDLCCGTGDLAAELRDLGFEATGVDGSEEMLRRARKAAPGVRFVHADARDFRLETRFHAVLCLFDSLNHVLTLQGLAQVFGSVHESLEPGGGLLFDLNTEPGYVERWNDTFGFVDDDLACLVRSSYDGDARLANFDATVFELGPEGSWSRSDVHLTQASYEAADVTAVLSEAGFVDIKTIDGESELGFGGPGRVFFTARRGAADLAE